MKFVIAHLYPREMSIYGDMGNIIALTKRLQWRGHEVVITSVEVGEPFDFASADIVFGGGGQDSGQLIVGADLLERAVAIRQAVDAGMPMLVICGLYQLFGRGFTTMEGQHIPGIDVFRAATLGSTTRMIGNIAIESPYGPLVGFENHSGQTILEKSQTPLGRVKRGYGNTPKGRFEGAITHNAIGTYLHGPILPKNPRLADVLIATAFQRRGIAEPLEPLDDTIEIQAADSARHRPQ